jgi:hypothetical protein
MLRQSPEWVFKSPPLFSEADLQTERLQWRKTWTCKAAIADHHDRPVGEVHLRAIQQAVINFTFAAIADGHE